MLSYWFTFVFEKVVFPRVVLFSQAIIICLLYRYRIGIRWVYLVKYTYFSGCLYRKCVCLNILDRCVNLVNLTFALYLWRWISFENMKMIYFYRIQFSSSYHFGVWTREINLLLLNHDHYSKQSTVSYTIFADRKFLKI